MIDYTILFFKMRHYSTLSVLVLFPKNIIEIMTGQVEKQHEVMCKYILSRRVKLKGHMFFIWLIWLIFQTAALLSKQETLIF